ncbi:DUF305 domain-containing protein [Pseudonocardia nigra]|uniref:DUF305 domain-containing protein n=1 Tax=Pseudonocardia nigra TaxID=1921578 RepID=UPI001C5D290C|nr:DUF305 domain-containing protein [Pseudonocardia nigra]
MTSTAPARRIAGVAGAVLAAVALAGCGGEAAAPADSGSPPATSSAPTSTTAQADEQFNEADVRFAQMMIPHHRQAIEMAELAADRAQNQEVEALAEEVMAAQDPEIETMTGFLESWGAEVPADDSRGGMDHGDTGHGDMGGMSGMMTPEQMQQLRYASGPEFDRMFLEMMIAHHEGAVTDAERELAEGVNEQAKALASEITDAQTAEIERMQMLLQTV